MSFILHGRMKMYTLLHIDTGNKSIQRYLSTFIRKQEMKNLTCASNDFSLLGVLARSVILFFITQNSSKLYKKLALQKQQIACLI